MTTQIKNEVASVTFEIKLILLYQLFWTTVSKGTQSIIAGKAMELFMETTACGRDAIFHGYPGDKGLAITFKGLPLVTCFKLVLTSKGPMP